VILLMVIDGLAVKLEVQSMQIIISAWPQRKVSSTMLCTPCLA
jgi:hypothetical protein